jgi:hypothetical protein
MCFNVEQENGIQGERQYRSEGRQGFVRNEEQLHGKSNMPRQGKLHHEGFVVETRRWQTTVILQRIATASIEPNPLPAPRWYNAARRCVCHHSATPRPLTWQPC